jgi:hypothetical protein
VCGVRAAESVARRRADLDDAGPVDDGGGGDPGRDQAADGWPVALSGGDAGPGRVCGSDAVVVAGDNRCVAGVAAGLGPRTAEAREVKLMVWLAGHWWVWGMVWPAGLLGLMFYRWEGGEK